MRGTVFGRLRLGAKNLLRDKRGNAMFLTAAAILPIIGLLGSGIDIGRAYMAQLRLQQACDAGVLAGRRAMAGSTYTTFAQGEANKMFHYNFKNDAYGSSDVTFTSQAQGASSVSGTASAELPTELMQIFDFQEFDLTVSCEAKLEISNADVMMVLDVTGSMTTVNSGDSVNRMEALKEATMDFFDTLTTADVGDGRLRFGVVPYSSTANVGAILYAKNPAWLADTLTNYPSRTPVTRTEYPGPGTTVLGTPANGTAAPTDTWSNYADYGSGITQTNCTAAKQGASSTPTKSGGTSTSGTATHIDGNGNQVTTENVNQTWTYKAYEYRWNNSKCQRRQRNYSYNEATPSTTTKPPVQVFDNKYKYESRTFDVSAAKGGSGIVTSTGDGGVDRTTTWGGCVMERKTTAFAANQTAPATALDMDVDTAPTSDDDTKWKLLIPEIAFPRASGPGSTPSDKTVTGSITKNSSDVSAETGTNGNWQNYSRYWSNGWGVCPVAAMKLTAQTAADRSTFNTYIQSLQPVGGTYHDAGMVWGVRLLSPDGMFADENADSTAPNKRPISRHIVFMTDGEMSANMGNLTFQGYEWIDKRIGGTDDASLTARHNNRFAQLCEKAKAKNITIWVVGFGVTLNTSLTNCATPGKAYQANNAAQLNDNFQAIARQISKLRLSQ